MRVTSFAARTPYRVRLAVMLVAVVAFGGISSQDRQDASSSPMQERGSRAARADQARHPETRRPTEPPGRESVAAPTPVPTPGPTTVPVPTTAPVPEPLAPTSPPQEPAPSGDGAAAPAAPSPQPAEDLDPEPPPSSEHRVPSSIDSSGTSDVTAPLASFIRSVPDGSTIQFPPGATYRIDGTVLVADRRDLVFEGNGATFVAVTPGDRERRHWRFRDGSNLVVRNMTVRGAHPNGGMDGTYSADKEAQHGFDIGGVQGFELAGVTVTDVWGDFVYVGNGKVQPARDVHVHGGTFARSGRQGISVTGAERVLIDGNVLEDVRRTAFDLEPPGVSWSVRNVTIRGNRVTKLRLNFVSAKGQGDVSGITIEKNTVADDVLEMRVVAPEGTRRSGWRVLGNVAGRGAGNPNGMVMSFVRVDAVEVRGNTQPMKPDRNMYLVATTDSCGSVVDGNEVVNAAGEWRVDTPCRQ